MSQIMLYIIFKNLKENVENYVFVHVVHYVRGNAKNMKEFEMWRK